MSDPRNVAHAKKVTQEKKHQGRQAAPAVQPGKKPAASQKKSDPAGAAAVPITLRQVRAPYRASCGSQIWCPVPKTGAGHRAIGGRESFPPQTAGAVPRTQRDASSRQQLDSSDTRRSGAIHRVARAPHHCATGHARAVAPPRRPTALALEESTSWTPTDSAGASALDCGHGESEPNLGRGADRGRIVREAWDLCVAPHRQALHAQTAVGSPRFVNPRVECGSTWLCSWT